MPAAKSNSKGKTTGARSSANPTRSRSSAKATSTSPTRTQTPGARNKPKARAATAGPRNKARAKRNTNKEKGNGNGNGNGLAAKDLGEIAAAISALIAVLAGVAVTGVLQRTQRDHGVWLLAAFACVLAAGVVWLLAVLWQGKTERVFQSFGAVGFAVGIALALVAVLLTQQEAERPAVAGQFDPKTGVFSGSVQAAGLRPTQRIVVRVDGLNYDQSGDQVGEVKDVKNLHFAVVGPDPDGNVDEPFHVAVPPGQFAAIGVKGWTGRQEDQCSYRDEVEALASSSTPQKERAGCLILSIPVSVARPQLTADWEKGGRVLVLHVSAHRAQTLVGVRAVTLHGKSRSRVLTWFGDPAEDGSLNTSIRLPLPENTTTVCAEARYVPFRGRIFRVQCPLLHRSLPFARLELAAPEA